MQLSLATPKALKTGISPSPFSTLLGDLNTSLLPPCGSPVVLRGATTSLLVERHRSLASLVESRSSLKELERDLEKWTICEMKDETLCLFQVSRHFEGGSTEVDNLEFDNDGLDGERIKMLISALNERIKIKK